MPDPIGSVVIPAHDEAAVIDRCLSTLIGNGERDLEIVVVANACNDDTAERARRHGVRVIETPDGGKALALNLGDRSCTAFPRIYLDADVDLERASALRVIEFLRASGVSAAAPRLRWSADGLPWSVRAYYRVWSALPYVNEHMIGSGVYALSEAGRTRFDHFPDVIADDGFVLRLFGPTERRTVPDCAFTIHPPRSLRALIGVKTRAWVGNEQLFSSPRRARASSKRAGRASILLRRPDLWSALPVYALVYGLARLRGRRRLRRGNLQWTRDVTSRVTTS